MSARIDGRARSARYPVMLIALVTAGTIGHAASEIPAAPNNATFEQLDADRDGHVSQDEARMLGGFETAFESGDGNRDGKLDAGEFARAQSFYDRMRAEQFVDDSMTTARVRVALFKAPQLNAHDVKVETREGTVLLSGVVADADQARRAMEIASGVRGVGAIRNALILEREEGEAPAGEKSR